MPRKKDFIPQLYLHKASGQAVARFDGKVRYFGKWGSKPAKEAYARALMEWTINDSNPEPDEYPTLQEVVDLYLAWARTYYKAGSSYTNRAYCINHLELYLPMPAHEFGPRHLKSLQKILIAKGLARGSINAITHKVRHMFKWAVGEELVPADLYHRLQAVPSLKKGRTEAREKKPVSPVDWITVEKTLEYLPLKPRRIVRLMWWTGMRPGEACSLHAQEINRSETSGSIVPKCIKPHITAMTGSCVSAQKPKRPLRHS